MAVSQTEIIQPRLVAPAGDDPPLKLLRIPEGWDATILTEFSSADPAFLKATPEGHLFVTVIESPPDGSQTGVGRILRLTNRNWAGKAGEIHEFVPRLDSPRGLEWDGEWLYVMNPPNLNAVRDTDGDQVADEDRTLVTGITSGNGISLGIDGWLYLAIGDGGLSATGTDGASLDLRSGGVARVRPDGSGLHLFSRGVRGIVEVAVSPTLDVFARGSAESDIGWTSRLHHFTGLDRHGYPSRFRNFEEDCVPPLAQDSAGSSGGALFLPDPSHRFPGDFRNILLTADPGQHTIFRHRLTADGASWQETARHGVFEIPEPGDLDVDGYGRLYVSSRGKNGFVAQLVPPATEPVGNDFPDRDSGLGSLPDGDLSSPQLQQFLLRNQRPAEDLISLEHTASIPSESLRHRIGAIFLMKQAFGENANAELADLAKDPLLLPFVLRALGDFPDQKADLDPGLFSKALSSEDPRARREAVFAISRLKLEGFVPDLARLAASDDPVVAHMSINALGDLRQIDACFEILDEFENYKLWPGIFRALAQIHEMRVVNGIISRLEKTDSSLFRTGALKTLARLYHREGEWDEESALSSPDIRGPYLDPVTWEGTAPIDAVIQKALRDRRVNKTFLFREISRNRIPFEDFKTLLSIAAVTPELEEPTVTLLLETKQAPEDSLPFLTFIATSEDRPGDLRLGAAIALARARDDMAATSAFRLTLEREEIEGIPHLRNELKTTLLENAFHEKRYDWLLEEAHGTADEAGILAWTILLQLTRSANLTPGARDEIAAAIERIGSNPGVLRRLLLATSDLGYSWKKSVVIDALDHSDPTVSEAARKAAAALESNRIE